MTLFLIGVAVLFIGCRVLQVKLDRYSRSLQNDALKAALMEQRKGWEQRSTSTVGDYQEEMR